MKAYRVQRDWQKISHRPHEPGFEIPTITVAMTESQALQDVRNTSLLAWFSFDQLLECAVDSRPLVHEGLVADECVPRSVSVIPRILLLAGQTDSRFS